MIGALPALRCGWLVVAVWFLLLIPSLSCSPLCSCRPQSDCTSPPYGWDPLDIAVLGLHPPCPTHGEVVCCDRDAATLWAAQQRQQDWKIDSVVAEVFLPVQQEEEGVECNCLPASVCPPEFRGPQSQCGAVGGSLLQLCCLPRPSVVGGGQPSSDQHQQNSYHVNKRLVPSGSAPTTKQTSLHKSPFLPKRQLRLKSMEKLRMLHKLVDDGGLAVPGDTESVKLEEGIFSSEDWNKVEDGFGKTGPPVVLVPCSPSCSGNLYNPSSANHRKMYGLLPSCPSRNFRCIITITLDTILNNHNLPVFNLHGALQYMAEVMEIFPRTKTVTNSNELRKVKILKNQSNGKKWPQFSGRKQGSLHEAIYDPVDLDFHKIRESIGQSKSRAESFVSLMRAGRKKTHSEGEESDRSLVERISRLEIDMSKSDARVMINMRHAPAITRMQKQKLRPVLDALMKVLDSVNLHII